MSEFMSFKRGIRHLTTGAAALCLLVAAAAPLAAQTELGSEDDLTVKGQDGTAADPDVEINGFSVFGATQAAYTGITAAPGNVVVNGFLSVSSGAYLVGSSTFPAASRIFINDGAAGQMLRKNAAGHLEWTNASALGDNLGDHTATRDLAMGSYAINSSTAINAAYYQIDGSTVLIARPDYTLGLGDSAGLVSTGTKNVFLGAASGSKNLNGNMNTFVGMLSGYNSTTGDKNVLVGYYSGYNNTGTGNTFVGSSAGNKNLVGSYNLGVGYQSLYYNESGEMNVAVGPWAGMGVTGQSYAYSTMLGYAAGRNLQGNYNLLLGYHAGYNMTTGANNIIIGQSQEASAPTASNELNVGGVLYGDLAAKTLGVGRVSPQAALDVVSTGTLATQYAQIWRNSSGVEVASLTATGQLYATLPAGAGNDNLGDHTATKDLNLAQFAAVNVSSLSMTGDGLRISTSLYSGASGLFISTSGAIMTMGPGNGTVSPDQRGIGAVDLQTYRTSQTDAAEGPYSVISGGKVNSISPKAEYSAVGGGSLNAIGDYGTGGVIAGGENNLVSNTYGVVAGGYDNESGLLAFVGGGQYNSALGNNDVVMGGERNAASGGSSVIPGGMRNKTSGSFSLAGGYLANSSGYGAFTWSDGQGYPLTTPETVNNVDNRAWFKMGGGFLVTGSTSAAMSGTKDRGVLITGNGLVGISTGVPYAAMDIVSTGTVDTVWAQIWRNSSGVEVASMTSTGKLYATLPNVAGDNLGDHTATQDLTMSQKSILQVASMTMVGKGLQIGTDLTSSGNGIFISTSGAIITMGLGNGPAVPNARGLGAVDLQTYRFAGAYVSSGAYSTIGGGMSNSAGGAYSVVPGGSMNKAAGNNSTVGGGSSNDALQENATVSGGQANVVTSNGGVVAGGYVNRAGGAWDSTVSGGTGNTADGNGSAVSGGYSNMASGSLSAVPGGQTNTAKGDYSFAAGSFSSSTAHGAFTWTDSQQVANENGIKDRTLFKNRGGFVVTGSTNTNMTGTQDRGVLITGNGLVGISTGVPYAALDVVSTGTLVTQYAQIWRNSAGTAVASMTATGLLYASLPPSAGSDNLGNHVATTTLQMGVYGVNTSSNVTAARYQIAGSTVLAILPGSGSLAVGPDAGSSSTGSSNLFVGATAGYKNTTGDSNVFLGAEAGYSNISGYNNNFMGWDAGYANTSGGENNFMGAEAGASNTLGSGNNFIGGGAGYSNTTGENNNALGKRAGFRNVTGSANTLLGHNAGYGTAANSYSSSTLVGYGAGYSLSTGADNIFLGYKAGYSVTTGTGNIVIGYDQGTSAAAANNELNIGGLVFGNLSTKMVGISTVTPQGKLHINTLGAGNIGQIIQRTAGQTADLSQWRTEAGWPTVVINSNGKMAIGGDTALAGAMFSVTPDDVAGIGAVIRGQSGQTADLQQWQSSGGTVVGRVAADGKTAVGGATAPTYKLEVQSSGASTFQVDPQTGYVSLRVGGVEVARLKP